jgi:4-hydroxybenzoate polyprenyltransferase
MSLNFHYFTLLRPKHWLKNVLIGLPLLLSNQFTSSSLFNFFSGFVAFSALASGGYILNDIRDVEKDRLHQKKKFRPIAAGSVDVANAFYLAVLLILLSFLISYTLGLNTFFIAILYFAINYFYSLYGKEIRFFDILLLSSFYIIRIFYGAAINEVTLTGWFMATITFIVLSLSVNKRFMECKNSNFDKIPGRGYTKNDQYFLQILMINLTIGAIVLLNIHAYFVLMISSPIFFVLINLSTCYIALFYFDDSSNKSEDPVERILNSKSLLVTLCIILFFYVYEILMKGK